MAGWDAYIDNLLAYCRDSTGDSHCDKACIIGLNGSKWTSDTHKNALKISQTEASAIAGCVSSKNFSTFQASGVVVEGQKFQFLRADDETKLVLAKKKGTGGLTIQASKTAIVIGHCPEGKQQGHVNKGVDSIVQYLDSQNM